MMAVCLLAWQRAMQIVAAGWPSPGAMRTTPSPREATEVLHRPDPAPHRITRCRRWPSSRARSPRLTKLRGLRSLPDMKHSVTDVSCAPFLQARGDVQPRAFRVLSLPRDLRGFGMSSKENDLDRYRDLRDLEYSGDREEARRATAELQTLKKSLYEDHHVVSPDAEAPPSRRPWLEPEDRD